MVWFVLGCLRRGVVLRFHGDSRHGCASFQWQSLMGMVRKVAPLRSHVNVGIIWGVPKIRGTILGAMIIRTIVYWGLYWGPLLLGNYHIGSSYRDSMSHKNSRLRI